MNKTAAVREALKAGEVLTVRSISRRWDINCPYAVIRDIRKAGLNVADRVCESVAGARYKEYYFAG